VLEAVVKVEPKLDINIQLLWSFVSSLCHDFSKYYRKNKILMVCIYESYFAFVNYINFVYLFYRKESIPMMKC
jgi:hypothetical protein